MVKQHPIYGIIDATDTFTWVSGGNNPGSAIDYNEPSVGQIYIYNGGFTQSIVVEDNDSDTWFYAQDGDQKTVENYTINGTAYPAGTLVNLNYQVTFEDTATGEQYTVHSGGLGTIQYNLPTEFYIWVDKKAPPEGAELEVVAHKYTGYMPYNTIACFTAGTLVATAEGAVPVEKLRPGDRVVTCDDTHKPLRRVLSRHVNAAELHQSPKLYPVRIEAGALGQNLPGQDLLVSRQHRMLVRSKVAGRMFGTPEVLVPACKLTDLPGIYQDREIGNVDYIHLVFDAHEVIFAEGAPTESFYPGPEAMKSLPPEAREEFHRLFPGFESGEARPDPARPIPEGHRQKALIRRMVKNRKPVLENI